MPSSDAAPRETDESSQPVTVNSNQVNRHQNIQLPASQLDLHQISLPEHTPPTMTTDNILFSMTSSQADNLEGRRNRQINIGSSRPRIELGEINFSQLMSDNREENAIASTPGGGLADNNNIHHQDSSSERLRVIWGTSIIIKDAINEFYNFLKYFTIAHLKRQENSSSQILSNISIADVDPFYPKLFQQIRNTETYSLEINCTHLKAYPSTANFYRQLINYPQEIIAIMDNVTNRFYLELFPNQADVLNNDPIQVRCFNAENAVNIRELDPTDIDKLITIKGLVVRTSNIIPDMRVATFECTVCSKLHAVENIKGRILEPVNCSRADCGAKNSMQILHNRCIFSDKQLIRLQETPDTTPDGQTPHAVTLCVYDSLVDSTRPGDRIEVTGIFRSTAIRANPRQRKLKSLFRTFVDVIHMKPISDIIKIKSTILEDEKMMEVDDEVKEQILQLSRDPNVYDRLANSIAPSIWGLENVKKALLLQLFGGVAKNLSSTTGSSSNGSQFRGDINILLAGDPGVSKSQLLQYVHKLSPRGIYTSGKGSSAVGLTAYITRDPESRQLVLESGALVLSDGGTCCIDEFDKMSDETRAILHEAMEQQTISVAKAGIITTLNARAAILASANPIESKYNPSRSIVENLNLPPTLLSRFDIICLILDSVHLDEDQRLARHLVSLYSDAGVDNLKDDRIIDLKLFKEYIKYARTIEPVIDDVASKDLIDGYVSMRRLNGGSTKTISATTRQLESLIRLSEAHAKMRLSRFVEAGDVKEAIRLIKEALLSNAIDPLTGKIDMDLIATGKSSAIRERQADLKKQLKLFIDKLPSNGIEFESLLSEMNSQSSVPINETWLRDVLKELIEEEYIYVAGGLNYLNRKSNPMIQKVLF